MKLNYSETWQPDGGEVLLRVETPDGRIGAQVSMCPTVIGKVFEDAKKLARSRLEFAVETVLKKEAKS